MNLPLVLKYINYQLTAYTEHDLHSPFLYNFYMELINNENPYGDFESLQQIRKTLLNDVTIIEVTDFGAGSKKTNSTIRSVKQIASYGISTKKQAEFLYRLINKFQPNTVVELGTSLGLTTLYLSKAAPHSKIYTIEGCYQLHQFSIHLFNQHHCKNITSINGHFDDEFPKLLQNIHSVDFLYVDGNHGYEATLHYFQLALQKKNTNSVFVFDDIYWSRGMQKAWEEIHRHPEVTLSLDLFYIGIVFFRTESKQKERFVLKF